MESDKEWYTVQEFADLIGVSCNTVIRRCANGTLTRTRNVGTPTRRVFRIHRDCISDLDYHATPGLVKPLEELGRCPMLEMFGA
ncbi:hypothetical protein Q31a_31020 [Aureliella helgolandensis]|uniref:Helix-turn-helix domain protein n=1 Tax=Aureliella helgolandensis TaxID=2527968 RepID=A0A518G866_9BACT|nr:hypothetical protein Q31a_31020 [Aureliella helgolandensis]